MTNRMDDRDDPTYVPALGHAWPTTVYDPVVRVTTREVTFKKVLLGLARLEVNLVRGLGDRLPFPDRSFDRVVSSLFFHHLDLEAKGRISAEIFRVLSPGGELHVADWGVPTNPLMRALFLPIQVLDGFANTGDNVRGLLPRVFEASGFENVGTQGNLSTAFGTLSYIAGHKPV